MLLWIAAAAISRLAMTLRSIERTVLPIAVAVYMGCASSI